MFVDILESMNDDLLVENEFDRNKSAILKNNGR